MTITFDHRVPSQYMRQVIARLTSSHHWDWNTLFGIPEFRQTCTALEVGSLETV
jgi:hypothetical protein